MTPLSFARGFASLAGVVFLAGLAACSEKPQNRPARNLSSPAYMGTQGGAFQAPGWKAGDPTSWEQEMRKRTQAGQNEYPRLPGRS